MPPDVKHIAKLYTERSIRKLWTIADDPATPSLVQVAACNALLDRGWGKPVTPIEATLTSRIELMSDAELNASIRALYAEGTGNGRLLEAVPLPQLMGGVSDGTSAGEPSQRVEIADE